MLAHARGPKRVWGRHSNLGKVLHPMPNGDGYKTRIKLNMATKGGVVPSFNDFHLCMRVFEDSCKASGMLADLEWRDAQIPEDRKNRYLTRFWNDLATWTHCRVCTARRSV